MLKKNNNTSNFVKRVFRHIGLVILDWPVFRYMKDEKYLRLKYRIYYGKKLNLEKPETFNEKIQWLKLYNRNPQYARMVDKADVKDYIADIIGEDKIIPTYGIWESFSDIDFDSLPEQFVLKCTHDSSSVVICRNKSEFDIEKAWERINRGLTKDFYSAGREWAYKKIKPRIIAEKYMTDSGDDSSSELRDYKFFCFNGTVRCLKVDFDRFVKHRANYYDIQGSFLPFEEVVCPSGPDKEIILPPNLDEMVLIAQKLADGIPFVRVDLYNVDGKIYFGEMTFYPASGFGFFNPNEWDYTLGSWLTLPNVKER